MQSFKSNTTCYRLHRCQCCWYWSCLHYSFRGQLCTSPCRWRVQVREARCFHEVVIEQSCRRRKHACFWQIPNACRRTKLHHRGQGRPRSQQLGRIRPTFPRDSRSFRHPKGRKINQFLPFTRTQATKTETPVEHHPPSQHLQHTSTLSLLVLLVLTHQLQTPSPSRR